MKVIWDQCPLTWYDMQYVIISLYMDHENFIYEETPDLNDMRSLTVDSCDDPYSPDSLLGGGLG